MSNRNSESKALFVDPSKPDLRILEAALRNPVLRPAGFGPWNYAFCKTCAMEIAYLFWPQLGDPERWELGEIAKAFGISRNEVGLIFLFAYSGTHVAWHEITPEMVADKIVAALPQSNEVSP